MLCECFVVMRMFLVAWPSVLQQHDAAEFLSHLLKRTWELDGTDFGSWGAREQVGDAIWDRITEPLLSPLPIAMPPSSSEEPVSLQTIIDHWSGAYDHQALHHPPPTFLVLQVLRYTVVARAVVKRTDQISAASLRDTIQIPVFTSVGMDREHRGYQVVSLALHHGPTPQEGHYTAYLRCAEGWQLKNDALVNPALVDEPSSSDLAKVYLICLCSADHGSAGS